MPAVVVHPTHGRSQLREAILAVSERIGSELGQSSLTMRNIAAGAGVSPTILYQYFDSKAAILRELQTHAQAELAARLDTATTDATRPRESLRALCLAYLEFARRSPWLYSLLFGNESTAMPPRADTFSSRAASCLVVAGVQQPGVEPATAGLQLWAAMHGLALALGGGVVHGLLDEPTFVQGYIRTVLAGLTA
jgi:AcrR family transcriptional regulator